MKKQLLTATGATALLLLGQSVQANTLVGTIIGAYDGSCTAVNCTNGGTLTLHDLGGGSGDTPNLYIQNLGASSFTNVQMVFTGYQSLNAGTTETITLPDMAAHSVYAVHWAAGAVTDTGPSGNTGAGGANRALFANDYDDEWGENPFGSITPAQQAACNLVNSGICAHVGNFNVAMSAKIGVQAISADFSPTPGLVIGGQAFGNVPGVFVPWEGLDSTGLSEQACCDQHTSTTPGVLADIFTGTNQGQPVPEPSTIALFGAGLGALAIARRRRKSV